MSGAKVTESGGSVPKYGREHQKAIRGSRKGPNFASPPYKAAVITRQELIHTQSRGTQQFWSKKCKIDKNDNIWTSLCDATKNISVISGYLYG